MNVSVNGAWARPYILKGLLMKRLATALALAMALASGMQAASAETLAAIKDRGELICGGNGTLAGFGLPDPQGNWTGFDVDFCRAIAAAIFNDPTKVKFVPLTAKDRFTALQSGEIDVLSRNTTWTLSRDTSLGLDFPAITFYDGQGFMVRKPSRSARRSSSTTPPCACSRAQPASSTSPIISAPTIWGSRP